MKFIRENIKCIVIVLLIILFTISIVPRNFQNDTFYIIALGRDLIENGISDMDPFSWHEGLKYQTPHWFFDYLNGLIYNVFELEGLYIFVCAISVIFMLVIYFNMVNRGINWVVAYISTMITAYLLKDMLFTDRAQLLSYLLFFIEITLIESFLKQKSKLVAVGLFIIAVLIANLHAGAWPLFFVLFLPYIGEYVINLFSIKEVVKRRLKKEEFELKQLENHEGPSAEIERIKVEIEKDKKFIESADKKEVKKFITKRKDNIRWLILIMFICIIAGFITPRPNVPFTYFLKISAGNTMGYINEHMPVILAGNWPFMIMLILTISMFTFTDTKMELSHALLLLGLFFMSVISVRHVMLLLIFGSYIITKMIDDFLNKYGHEDIEQGLKKKIKNVFFVLLCIVVSAFTIYFFIQNKNESFINENIYPVKATEWIKNNLDIDKIRIYNHYNVGSYLLYKNVPVFVDSRSDLYTPQFNGGVEIFNDFINVLYGNRTFKSVFDEYDITHAILAKSSIEDIYMKEDESCIQIYEDENFVIYKYN